MANLYVKASGSNTSPYDTWAKAATSLITATALAAAGDTVWVDSALAETGLTTANANYALAAGVRVISTSSAAEPPTTYNPGASIQTTTTNVFSLNGAGAFYGIAFKQGTGGSSGVAQIATVDNSSIVCEDCTFQMVSTASGCRFAVGVASITNGNAILKTRNCTFIFAATGQGITLQGYWEDVGSTFAATGSVPASLCLSAVQSVVKFNGSDLAALSGSIVTPSTTSWFAVYLTNCKVHASVTPMAAGAVTDGSGEIFLSDCDSGDNHFKFAHYDYRGNTIVGNSIYLTAGATYDGSGHESMAITGVNATIANPYYSPWIDQRADANVGGSVTPYFELARDGSVTKYTDGEVWAEFLIKTTSGSTRTTLYTDRVGPAGTAAVQTTGVGISNWTGLSGTAVTMKANSGAALTPAEIGFARARIGIAINATVYLDPQIHGISGIT